MCAASMHPFARLFLLTHSFKLFWVMQNQDDRLWPHSFCINQLFIAAKAILFELCALQISLVLTPAFQCCQSYFIWALCPADLICINTSFSMLPKLFYLSFVPCRSQTNRKIGEAVIGCLGRPQCTNASTEADWRLAVTHTCEHTQNTYKCMYNYV